jgi:hypothetical protein
MFKIYKIALQNKKMDKMAIQFCKFKEILFRKVVAIDEYYYQLK